MPHYPLGDLFDACLAIGIVSQRENSQAAGRPYNVDLWDRLCRYCVTPPVLPTPEPIRIRTTTDVDSGLGPINGWSPPHRRPWIPAPDQILTEAERHDSLYRGEPEDVTGDQYG